MKGKKILVSALVLGALCLGAVAMPAHVPLGPTGDADSYDLTPRLETLLGTGDLADVTILGVRPGGNLDAAAMSLQTDWHFVPAVGLDDAKQFHPGHDARVRLKQTAQRNGGMLRMDTLDGRVGPVLFLEYFTTAVDADTARAWLTAHFGRPERERRQADGRQMLWSGDDLRLQVDIVNEVEPFARRAGYVGKLAFTLWDSEYETYVSEVRLRCDTFNGLAVDRMTPVTRVWYRDNCPLTE